MLERYRPATARLSLTDASFLRSHFLLPPGTLLHDALHDAGIGQAEVVMALLHARRHDAVRLYVRWTTCPPQASPNRHLPLPRKMTREPDARRLVPLVAHNPLTIPTARERWALMARCRTLASYATRVPRWLAVRDVREWSRAGWLRVEEAA